MTRVLYFNPVGSIGGAEMCLLDLLASRKGLVVLGEDGPLREAVEGLGVRCLVAPLPASMATLGDSGGAGLSLLGRMARSVPDAARYLVDLRRLIRSERADVVQTNGMKAHLLGTLAAPSALPVVWHLHDYLGPRPAMARLLKTASKRRGLSVVAVSRSVAEDARRVLGPRVPVRAIHNAVDLRRFAPGVGDHATLDRAAGMGEAPAGTVRVGLVATFARWKGHRVFLDAVRKIADDVPARFYIIGGPIYRSAGSQWSMDEMRAEVEARGLADRVGLVGTVADPAPAFRSLDVAVHASTRPEPFGRSIVEAMASGVATVAILDGGAAELFEHGVSALGCPPDHPGALAPGDRPPGGRPGAPGVAGPGRPPRGRGPVRRERAGRGVGDGLSWSVARGPAAWQGGLASSWHLIAAGNGSSPAGPASSAATPPRGSTAPGIAWWSSTT